MIKMANDKGQYREYQGRSRSRMWIGSQLLIQDTHSLRMADNNINFRTPKYPLEGW